REERERAGGRHVEQWTETVWRDAQAKRLRDIGHDRHRRTCDLESGWIESRRHERTALNKKKMSSGDIACSEAAEQRLSFAASKELNDRLWVGPLSNGAEEEGLSARQKLRPDVKRLAGQWCCDDACRTA